MLSLIDFNLSEATLEFRHPFAARHWDRSGEVWSAMMEKYDELKYVSAEPGKVVFRLDYRFQLITELQSFTIFKIADTAFVLGAYDGLMQTRPTGVREISAFPIHTDAGSVRLILMKGRER